MFARQSRMPPVLHRHPAHCGSAGAQITAAAAAICPACQGHGARFVGQRPDVTLLRCHRCALVYAYPQPRERIRGKYTDEYDLAEHFGPLARRKRVLYQRRLAILPEPAPGRDRLCDVGCGDGQFLAVARTRGWRSFGVELNPPAARRAVELGASVRVGAVEELDDLEWGSFDLVTSWDVLEHSPEPRRFAERLAALLAPGGTLAVTTLNVSSLAWWVFGMRWSMVCEDHFTYWNRLSLTTLFESLGLVIVRREVFGLGRDFVAVIDWLRRRLARSPDTPSSAAAGAWDVAPVTLAFERLVNAVFNTIGGGVGIGLIMRKPGTQAVGRAG